ncbi:MAG: hypothetical protein ACPKQO_08800 [Nitrososphaeraceae archaeon]
MNTDNNNNCKICSNERISRKYCVYHEKALKDLVRNYDIWLKAYSQNLPWNEYMQKVQSLEYTGKWIKEVIKEELKLKK